MRKKHKREEGHNSIWTLRSLSLSLLLSFPSLGIPSFIFECREGEGNAERALRDADAAAASAAAA